MPFSLETLYIADRNSKGRQRCNYKYARSLMAIDKVVFEFCTHVCLRENCTCARVRACVRTGVSVCDSSYYSGFPSDAPTLKLSTLVFGRGLVERDDHP